MVKLTISFLVSFDNGKWLAGSKSRSAATLSKSTRTNTVSVSESHLSNQQRKGSSSRKSFRRSESISNNKQQLEIVIGQARGFLHCEYEILPKMVHYNVDFVYYGPIVQLFTVDGSITRRVHRVNRHDFCLFSLSHYIEFSDEEIINLHSNVCKVNFYDGKVYCNSRCFKNVPKIWYINENDKTMLFAEVFSSEKQSKDRTFYENVEDLYEKKISLGKLETVLEHYLSPVHLTRAELYFNTRKENKNTQTSFPNIPQNFDTILSCHEEEKVKSKSKKSNAAIASLRFPGEMLFTDPRIIDLCVPNEISPLRLFLTVQQLLTFVQRITFNPLVITISEVIDLPVEYLRSLSYEDIYVEYTNNLIGEVRTRTRPLSDKITFNESRAFLMHTIDQIDYVKFIQTNRLRVEIRGIKSPRTLVDCGPQLFGHEFTDEFISTRPTNETLRIFRNTFEAETRDRDNLLCVTALVNNGLLLHRWTHYSIQGCHNTTLTNENTLNLLSCPIHMKLAELNLVLTESSILKQDVLFSTNTCITMNMNFSYSLQPYIISVLATKLPLNRIFIIFYDETLAVDTYTAVLGHNISILSKDIVFQLIDPNMLYLPHETDKLKYQELHKQYRNVVTGFVIDNMKSYLMFFEGPAVGFIQHIWHSVMLMPTQLVKVYFDSDLIFNTRVYPTLMNTAGIYILTLYEPLEILFKMTFTYMKGNMSLPCSRALLKLDLMIKSQFMLQICQSRLCPTYEELVALQYEFGVWLMCARINPKNSISEDDDDEEEIHLVTRRGTYLTIDYEHQNHGLTNDNGGKASTKRNMFSR